MSAFYCSFYLGCKISICFFSHLVCHVIFHCFTCDTGDAYTAMLMHSTRDIRLPEMAIVDQLFNLLFAALKPLILVDICL